MTVFRTRRHVEVVGVSCPPDGRTTLRVDLHPFDEFIEHARTERVLLDRRGGGPFAGGSGGAGQTTTFTGASPLAHPLAPILANWLDNHMFVASTLIGFTVMERYPAMKVVVAHGKASWDVQLTRFLQSRRPAPSSDAFRTAIYEVVAIESKRDNSALYTRELSGRSAGAEATRWKRCGTSSARRI